MGGLSEMQEADAPDAPEGILAPQIVEAIAFLQTAAGRSHPQAASRYVGMEYDFVGGMPTAERILVGGNDRNDVVVQLRELLGEETDTNGVVIGPLFL